ncbi:MAG: phosphatidylserine decarboxylase family protein [Candidatus Babeliales bacterium]
MQTFITNNLLWSQAPGIVLVLVLCAILALWLYRPLLFLVILAAVFSIYFFRNPERVCIPALHDPSIIVCPADGKVISVTSRPDDGIEGYAHKVSIFLSPFDVHVNWVPVAGVVESIVYRSGTFSFAFLPKSSELNERNDVHIRARNNQELVVRQIAGTIARRICCWVKPDDTVSVGQTFGMIRFGSRVDVLLPTDVRIVVGVGQRVYGGQSVLGVWQ